MTEMETRGTTCPKCDPEHKAPDYVSGYKLGLKYLMFGTKCRQCGTELIDLGPMIPPRGATMPPPPPQPGGGA